MPMAPLGAMGKAQIIPSRGAHDQIYPTDEQIQGLVLLGLIDYEPEYGPGAKVYRPRGAADTEKVKSWLC